MQSEGHREHVHTTMRQYICLRQYNNNLYIEANTMVRLFSLVADIRATEPIWFYMQASSSIRR
jgi:hypothetical protein